MKRFAVWALAAFYATLMIPVFAKADPPIYGVQASACGTPGNTPVTGQSYPVNILNGVMCVSGTFTGTVTSTGVISGPLGTGTTASGVRVTLSTTDAAALQSIITALGWSRITPTL